MKSPNRRYVFSLITLTLVGVLTASVTGCSGETTKVAEGDAATRRKNKDDALDRMSNPFGTAPKTAAANRDPELPRKSRTFLCIYPDC